MKMFVTERRNQIMHLLQDKQRLTVKDLAANIGVSEATLRSDLNQMEEEGLLTRTHGGAVLNDTNNETSYSARAKRNQKEKKLIAEKALEIIEEKQCILLDASSTTMELAYLLKQKPIRLTVITSGVKTALELNENPNITVILLGGMLTKGSSSLEGTLGLGILEQVNIDLMFVSASGFTPDAGLTDFNLYEVQLKRELIKKSKAIIALIDHTKIGTISSAIFAKTNQINTIITDTKLEDSIYTELSTTKNITIIDASS
ncbi:DeoR family transcriptional regulator [Aquibacillus halophilus]|uniref:DeoR family transcriptional regulator n=1 Tax=Aquibacillus halophilus TaxID=930132 RepID=A0A6A8DB78_9BACI|nr:DeoR/GlpR family DNA-binding transcription regulator [Aquibacillus halophilus]MRH42764.1 DeoR family transcriptional regulator [Aquibacillus halophilus]